MAAPTGPDSEIVSRLESFLEDAPPPRREEDESPRDVRPEDLSAPPHKNALSAAEEAASRDTDQPPSESVEPDEEMEEEAPEAAEAESEIDGEAPEAAIETLSDLARSFNVEESVMLDQLQVDIGDEKIPLARVISTYKAAPEAIRKYEEILSIDRDLEREKAQLRTEQNSRLAELAGTTQALIASANQEFSDVDWKSLEVEDPARYLILRGKREEMGKLIENAIGQVKRSEEEARVEAARQTQGNYEKEAAALISKMPTWAEPTAARQAMTGLRSFLRDSGFKDEEINEIQDHRMILVAYQASQLHSMKSEAPQKLKRLRELPRPTLKGGARQDDLRVTEQKKREQNFARLRKTGDERDAARLMEDLL